MMQAHLQRGATATPHIPRCDAGHPVRGSQSAAIAQFPDGKSEIDEPFSQVAALTNKGTQSCANE